MKWSWPCVYILTNKFHTAFYVGVTSDLIKRTWQHKNDLVDGFSSKYHVHKLVYYEQYEDMYSAICREKRLKKYKKEWKLFLIYKMNPFWKDLYYEIVQ